MVYVKDKKRTEGKVFASFSNSVFSAVGIDQEVLDMLDSEESIKLRGWLNARWLQEKARLENEALENLASTLALSTVCLNRAFGSTLKDDAADEIYRQMSILAKSLKKAGYDRPKPVKAEKGISTK